MTINVNEKLAEMSLKEKIGQMINVGSLEDENGIPSEEMKNIIETIKPGGIRIYGNSCENNTLYFKTAYYINNVKKWFLNNEVGIPPIIAADCENGISSIINHGVNTYPFLMGRSATNSIEMAAKINKAIAKEGKNIGLNMIQQPVVDVNTNPHNPIIGVRSAGDNPEQVVKYTIAQMNAQQNEGVMTVAKHYPGHGDTAVDSHLELPVIELEEKEFRNQHLSPFQKIIDAGVDAIMTAHIIFKCIDPENLATLSYPVLTELLREEQGFEGVVITDGMTMKAITDNYGPGEAAVKAVNAGCDIILASGNFEFQIETYNSMLKAARNKIISSERIDKSVKRILKLKKKYNLFNDKFKNKPIKPQKIFQTISDNLTFSVKSFRKSFTLIGNEEYLPIEKNNDILISGTTEVHNLADKLQQKGHNLITYQLKSKNKEQEISELSFKNAVELSESVNKVIFLNFSNNDLSVKEKELIEKINENSNIIIIALGLPYDYKKLPDDICFIATYLKNRRGNPSPLPKAAVKAIIQILEGKHELDGELPVELD